MSIASAIWRGDQRSMYRRSITRLTCTVCFVHEVPYGRVLLAQPVGTAGKAVPIHIQMPGLARGLQVRHRAFGNRAAHVLAQRAVVHMDICIQQRLLQHQLGQLARTGGGVRHAVYALPLVHDLLDVVFVFVNMVFQVPASQSPPARHINHIYSGGIYTPRLLCFFKA